jgi:hypothetical protein
LQSDSTKAAGKSMRVIGSSPHLGAGPALSAVCAPGPLARVAQVRLTLFALRRISIDFNGLCIDN